MTNPLVDLMSLDDTFEGEAVRVEIGNKNLAVYNVDGKIYCTDNICTHGNALLSDGFLEGFEIECPFHQGRFDVRDGRVTCDPVTKPVKSYPIHVKDGRVFVDLS
jgi:naphthalene 1,2-dioxygenase system ferredoxin subunit